MTKLPQLVFLSILLLAASVNFSQADTNEVVTNAADDSFECDLIPEIAHVEGYEERCVKKNVPVIVMKKNLRSGRIVNQDGQNRNHRPGPYRRRTTTPRTYYRRRTTTPRTYYIIDRTDEYDSDSDYSYYDSDYDSDSDSEYSDYDDSDDEEYYFEDEDDGYGFFDLVFDIFF